MSISESRGESDQMNDTSIYILMRMMMEHMEKQDQMMKRLIQKLSGNADSVSIWD